MNPPNLVFTFEADTAPTIAAELRERCSGVSWNRVRQWLSNGHIRLNDIVVREEAIRLRRGDVIAISPGGSGSVKTQVQTELLASIPVVHIDEHVVIVDKPSGMTVQIVAESDEEFAAEELSTDPTLQDLIVPLVKKLVARNPSLKSGTPRLVHRIDKDTSGLLVFARTGRAYDSLKRQFFEHSLDREYLAVVQGELVKPRTIDSWLVRNRGDGKRGSIDRATPNAKHAVTHVQPVEHFRGATLVSCRLETGRTHQIRIHLSEAGFPLLGDPLYGENRRFQPFPPRLALHAQLLGFDHPSGKRMTFRSKMPPELLNWLEKLTKY